jgi:hypothetical protein
MSEARRERDRLYQRRRRAEGKAWDQQPENEERVAERKARWYWNLSGVEYNLRLLKSRRQKGLARMARRNEGQARKLFDDVREAVYEDQR